jgi:integrase
MPLTDLAARKAKAGPRDYKMADGKGLTLLVRTNGAKLWRFRYRFAGKEKMISLGVYPEVSIAEARDRLDTARKHVRDGRDPSLENRRAEVERRSAAASSFETMAREWYELNIPRWTKVHARNVLTSLERDVFPKVGRFSLGDIDAPLLLEVLQPIERRGAIETARRIRQRISMVFSYAMSKGRATSDPAALIAGAMKPKPRQRRQPAVTNLAELRELMAKSEASGAYPLTILASRLLALTAVRPGVVRGAEWGEFRGIDWDSCLPKTAENRRELDNAEFSAAIWHIPAARMKLALDRKEESAFDHIVPLAPAAVDVLRAARVLSGRGRLVFPGQRHAHKPLSENAIGYLYNRVGWHGRHVPHGWRAAFSTIMNEREPADRATIDLMLAHTPTNKVEAAYNRAEHMERRRELAIEWAGLLDLGPADVLLGAARR